MYLYKNKINKTNMKKVMILASAVLLMSVVACKKADRVCSCDFDGMTMDVTIIDATSKKEAEALCEGKSKVTYSDGTTEENSLGCTLK